MTPESMAERRVAGRRFQESLVEENVPSGDAVRRRRGGGLVTTAAGVRRRRQRNRVPRGRRPGRPGRSPASPDQLRQPGLLRHDAAAAAERPSLHPVRPGGESTGARGSTRRSPTIYSAASRPSGNACCRPAPARNRGKVVGNRGRCPLWRSDDRRIAVRGLHAVAPSPVPAARPGTPRRGHRGSGFRPSLSGFPLFVAWGGPYVVVAEVDRRRRRPQRPFETRGNGRHPRSPSTGLGEPSSVSGVVADRPIERGPPSRK